MYHSDQIQKLHYLAQLKNVQTYYYSAFGTKIENRPEALIAILNALGFPWGHRLAQDLSNVDALIHEVRWDYWNTLAEPVGVFWEGVPAELRLRYPGSWRQDGKPLMAQFQFTLEQGDTLCVEANLCAHAVERYEEINGQLYVETRVEFESNLPHGYHECEIQLRDRKQKLQLIVAPWFSYENPNIQGRSLGLFAPLYAMRSDQTWGIGDYQELFRLMKWSYEQGCDFVGTLPMLALFADQPFVEPSPYSPLSRQFWNELYLDPRAAEEWKECAAAQKLVSTQEFQSQIVVLQEKPLVDYQGVSQLKRQVLELLAEEFFKKKKNKTKEFQAFLERNPQAEDYAEFRATCETRKEVWQLWPERLKQGQLQKNDYELSAFRYHLYSQWLIDQEMKKISEWGQKRGRGVYIDFPLSSHASGYDVWRDREAFVQVVSAGCPPDPQHVHGQDWGILPLHTETIRQAGYRYFRSCLEAHMRYAGLLRLDHVMTFFRLYWIPNGMSARDGVYVRYRLQECFAVLILESHRNQCVLIGEDLGTVPPEIRKEMDDHQILRMYVQQRKLEADPEKPLPEAPENCISSLNTHDMAPFSAFWQGLELHDKLDLKYFKPEELPKKQEEREKIKKALIENFRRKGLIKHDHPGIFEVLECLLKYNASESVKVMQVNIEDLWLETLPQNTPGTWKERPNWQRKWRYDFSHFTSMKEVTKLLKELTVLRQQGSS